MKGRNASHPIQGGIEAPDVGNNHDETRYFVRGA